MLVKRLFGVELPPRARRIRAVMKIRADKKGTTSACAENTGRRQLGGHGAGNYLRVRGEYWKPGHAGTTLGELPPRARRIRLN